MLTEVLQWAFIDNKKILWLGLIDFSSVRVLRTLDLSKFMENTITKVI
jgi:hypothetical protein